MNLHTLKVAPGSRKNRKRLGRGPGSGHGKTSGKGHKGQMARKGHKRKPGFEGGQVKLIRRIPKRGTNNKPRSEYVAVNVGELVCFDNGTEVTSALLKSAGLAKGVSGGIKILGRGELNKKLTVKASAFSVSGRAKIEAAGGICEVVLG